MSNIIPLPNAGRRFGSADQYLHLRAFHDQRGEWVDYLFTASELDVPESRAVGNPEDVPDPPGRFARAFSALFGH